jgi:hypothetical protein
MMAAPTYLCLVDYAYLLCGVDSSMLMVDRYRRCRCSAWWRKTRPRAMCWSAATFMRGRRCTSRRAFSTSATTPRARARSSWPTSPLPTQVRPAQLLCMAQCNTHRFIVLSRAITHMLQSAIVADPVCLTCRHPDGVECVCEGALGDSPHEHRCAEVTSCCRNSRVHISMFCMSQAL